MKKTLLLTLISLLLIGCERVENFHIILDPSADRVIQLKAEKTKHNITSINIDISGEIKGNASISLMLNEKIYKTKSLNGKFNFNWSGDWYSNEATIVYKPAESVSGKVAIIYKFINI